MAQKGESKFSKETQDWVCNLRKQIPVPTYEEIAQKSLAEIKVDLSISSIRRILDINNVRISTAQRSESKTQYGNDFVQKVADLKAQGLTRKQIAETLGVKESVVKNQMNRKSIPKMDPDLAQSHAYEAKIAKDPNAMQKMRASITTESHAKQSESLRRTYANNPELGKAASKRQIGIPKPATSKYTFSDLRAACEKFRLEFLHPEESNEKKIYDSGNQSNKWSVKCHCGNVWHPSLVEIVGRGSTKSCGCVKSFVETEVFNFIKSFCPDMVSGNWDIIQVNEGKAELDGYSPSKKTAFEFNGQYWHAELLKKSEARLKHFNKFLACQVMGVRLVSIFESEWFHRTEQVKGYLRVIFNDPSLETIGARKCEVNEVSYPSIKQFINDNHLQGGSRSGGKSFTLSRNGEIIAVAVYAKPRNSNYKNTAMELVRYCVKIGFRVPGGLARLEKAFVRTYGVKCIVSYSNNRWTEGGVYLRGGFKKISESPPSYGYFKKGTRDLIIHKSNFRLKRLAKIFPEADIENKTEWEIMQENKYDRIWDCGKILWVKTL